MKALAVFLILCIPAFGQKMEVKVVRHFVDGHPYTRMVPGIGIGNANATANFNSYGATANGSASSIYMPPHTIGGSLNHIDMLLLLPDGRHVRVYCDDHFKGLAQVRVQYCKNPESDELGADFSGEKVKLTWGVGIDGKKKESQTFIVGKVFPQENP